MNPPRSCPLNLLATAAACLFGAGCALPTANQAGTSALTQAPATVVIIAGRTATPVVVDGKLDDPAWQTATGYPMFLSKDKGLVPIEGGRVQLAWDQEFLYIGVKFTDSDVVQEQLQNQADFYRTGDLLEVFLKPQDSTWYWELYATPHNRQTVYWFAGGGRLGLESCSANPGVTLKVGAQVEGTFNCWQDVDQAWTAEMAVPVSALTANGDAFGPGSRWRVLVARYNYSRYLKTFELSMTPQLSISRYHNQDEYAEIQFAE